LGPHDILGSPEGGRNSKPREKKRFGDKQLKDGGSRKSADWAANSPRKMPWFSNTISQEKRIRKRVVGKKIRKRKLRDLDRRSKGRDSLLNFIKIRKSKRTEMSKK